MPTLFDPISLSPALSLPNRMLMAPLTRGRATREAVPTPLMAEYYAQRGDRDFARRPRLAIRARAMDRCAGRRLEASGSTGSRSMAPMAI